MKRFLLSLISCYSIMAMAQPAAYTAANAHSHNDYEKPFPFQAAYNEGFGSMEADLHLVNDTLLVGHDTAIAGVNPTFESLYLQPLEKAVAKNNGYPYADHTKKLQLLIDLKMPTLDNVVALLQKYPTLTTCANIRFVISGSRPDPANWPKYPAFIWFDGNLNQTYSAAVLEKIGLMSIGFTKYSKWNGKGRIPARELDTIQQMITGAHALGKPVRFWATPDNVNAWYHLMKLKVDYLNTDHIAELGSFLKKLPKTILKNDKAHELYQPQYKNDGLVKKVKNVILIIGDGTGLAQWYSGYTANHAQLNVFNMRSIGLSKTSSYDNFITDSAPGATALASGEKTNNRAVGVDHTGVALSLIPDYVAKKGMSTGLITSGDMTDATPAAFYGHSAERSNSARMFSDLGTSPVQLIMGAGNSAFNDTVERALKYHGFRVVNSVDSVWPNAPHKWVVMEERAQQPVAKGRGEWLQQAFGKSLEVLSSNKSGFFLMAEGAQVDHGGHDNDLSWLATEAMDLDRLVGKAMQFADANGETLVVVTADHETGGLTLMDGNYESGYIGGQFSTDDHTAVPVPVFAYGPQSKLFSGVYENTAIFNKIMQALGIQSGKTAGK
jgi:alkaline phosphatase